MARTGLLMIRKVTCANCAHVFLVTPIEEKLAQADYKKSFPEAVATGEEYVELCDTCYQEFIGWLLEKND